MSRLRSRLKEFFCHEYLVDFNGKRAYMRVKTRATERTAEVEASKLLRKPEIIDRLGELKEKRIKRIEKRADRIINEIDNLAMVDVADIFKPDGITIKNIHNIKLEVRKALAGLEVVEIKDRVEYECEECGGKMIMKVTGWIKKVKFWSKDRALENLGRHEKLFTDKVELSGNSKLSDRIKAARERLSIDKS